MDVYSYTHRVTFKEHILSVYSMNIYVRQFRWIFYVILGNSVATLDISGVTGKFAFTPLKPPSPSHVDLLSSLLDVNVYFFKYVSLE